ncbi:MAG TPA: regulatory protein RecX [Gammaproteobacteria bacterium]|nr:regulatory protein RecX [Gammaproteobacteria bacterium]
MRLLARREHAVGELQQKLVSRGYPSSEVTAALQQLQQQGLLSDRRFTETYVHYRVQRGDGPLKLRRELELRGVSANIFEPQLEQVDWSAVLLQHWQRRFSTPASNYREWARQARHLQSRGFSSEQIRCHMPARIERAVEDE